MKFCMKIDHKHAYIFFMKYCVLVSNKTRGQCETLMIHVTNVAYPKSVLVEIMYRDGFPYCIFMYCYSLLASKYRLKKRRCHTS
jgi:hypothetical protein